MGKPVFLFWPGDGRKAPNDLAKRSIEKATYQLDRALRKLGREPRRVDGFISKPHESLEKLGPITDPMIGVCVHWFYGPHTTEGVLGKDNPLMKRLLKRKGLHPAVFFHDVRWGSEWNGRFIWVLLNSGSSGAYAFNHDADTLRGVHSYRQPATYFPSPGGTFTGESLPGKVTWARSYIRQNALWMDIGRGEVVKLPASVRDEWWNGTTRVWPFMAADLGMSRDTLMAHYMSNHIAVAYGDIFQEMVALSQQLGFKVRTISQPN